MSILEIGKKKRKGRSVQELMGIKRFTDYGLLTNKGEILFFQVAPTNISVLSKQSIEYKINKLNLLMSAIPDIEITCTDSAESFDNNKAYLHKRYDEEQNPKVKQSLKAKRTGELLGRTMSWMSEMESGSDLYNTLSEVIGMTDIEMHRLGFSSLSEHFDKDGFAQTIADYLVETGTELTQSGNYHFEFSEINERFGINLPADKEMLDKLTEQLTSGENSLVVSDLNTDTDIDLNFYTLYCPNVVDEDCTEVFTQTM